jgi:hypothetical protein
MIKQGNQPESKIPAKSTWLIRTFLLLLSDKLLWQVFLWHTIWVGYDEITKKTKTKIKIYGSISQEWECTGKNKVVEALNREILPVTVAFSRIDVAWSSAPGCFARPLFSSYGGMTRKNEFFKKMHVL